MKSFKIAPVITVIGLIALSLLFLNFHQQDNLPRDARTLYLQYCASCHGENLDRFAAREWVYGSSVNQVSSTLKHGRPAIGMPEFGNAMTDAEIRILAEYTIENVGRVPAVVPRDFDVDDTFTSLDMKFRLEEVAGGDMRIPWGMAFLPDGSMLVAEKGGALYHVRNSIMTRVEGVPQVFVRGQGGLMEVTLHPDFKKNNIVYLAWTSGNTADAVNTSVGRGVFKDGRLTNFRELIHGLPATGNGVHFGSRIVFDDKGYLFFSIGDRGRQNNSQDLTNYNGKIHRINDDGSIPADNPFVNTPGAVKSIWSYGHRNPQGMYFDMRTKQLWSNEHGPRGGDELNLVEKGKNYGWPVISFGINYDGTVITTDTARVGMEQPVYQWNPSIAPSSLTRVRSDKYPGWEGDFLSGSLSFEYVERTIMRNNRVIGSERLLQGIGRVRNVMQAPDGYIYVAVENPGRVYRLVPVH